MRAYDYDYDYERKPDGTLRKGLKECSTCKRVCVEVLLTDGVCESCVRAANVR